ncbi:hypothetical protein CRM22_001275 [Opisthorchis felineus]|uniref:Uncharacterized protein n=1 Tax=Opisthorchis felineus TaxID=147828 RepID=A0A4S2MHE1_OPIFE|nr:hypothetical protein CRM22_001275 [Opisthorchis felineus]
MNSPELKKIKSAWRTSLQRTILFVPGIFSRKENLPIVTKLFRKPKSSYFVGNPLGCRSVRSVHRILLINVCGACSTFVRSLFKRASRFPLRHLNSVHLSDRETVTNPFMLLSLSFEL